MAVEHRASLHALCLCAEAIAIVTAATVPETSTPASCRVEVRPARTWISLQLAVREIFGVCIPRRGSRRHPTILF